MQKFGIFDQDGRATAFYCDEIHTEIPAGAVPLPDEQWQDLVSNQAGKRFIAGAVVDHVPTAAEIAQAVKASIQAELATTDLGAARILEDLISALAAKGIMTEADLPAAAQAKLARRRDIRAAL